MHKPFYASGFLYNSASGQILLQQLHATDTILVLFGGKSKNGSNPQTVFQHSVEKSLGRTIPTDSIHPVYDYIEDHLGEQFIFYAEVSNTALGTGWFSLSKLNKHAMSEQTRHDIVVGERVIRALIPQT